MTRGLLIAGVGNIFFGDDGFGVEVVRELAQRAWPSEVTVRDFGIRGFDLACALAGSHDAAILVDTTQRGGVPGTLYVIEPVLDIASAGAVDPHGLEPAKVLRLARELGELSAWVRVVGCEPLTFGTEEEPVMGLSAPVQRAVHEAMRLIENLVENYLEKKVSERLS